MRGSIAQTLGNEFFGEGEEAAKRIAKPGDFGQRVDRLVPGLQSLGRLEADFSIGVARIVKIEKLDDGLGDGEETVAGELRIGGIGAVFAQEER